MINVLGEDQLKPPVKRCVYCHEEKTLDKFPKHISHKDNLDTRCKECIRKQSKIRNQIKKTAPPKPEVCDCCGKIPLGSNGKVKWCLDHNHQTNTFRGWLCERCNLGIGQLGDNIDGVEKAVKYLKECNLK